CRLSFEELSSDMMPVSELSPIIILRRAKWNRSSPTRPFLRRIYFARFQTHPCGMKSDTWTEPTVDAMKMPQALDTMTWIIATSSYLCLLNQLGEKESTYWDLPPSALLFSTRYEQL